MRPTFPQMAEVLTPTKQGLAEILLFEVSAQEAERSLTRMYATGGREGGVAQGKYAMLKVNGSLVMSDTQMERDSNEEFLWQARGDVLIAGLGLGMIVLPALALKSVTSITVIEKNRDVIDIVLPQIQRAAGDNVAKLNVICADILEWAPPRRRWDTIYFDIWGDISYRNLREMRTLHKRFRPKLRPKGWISSWLYDEIREGYV